MDYIAIVSADGHIGMPYGEFESYIDPQYRDRLVDLKQDQSFHEMLLFGQLNRLSPEVAEVVDERHVHAERKELYWDADKRLAQLDQEGIAGEIVLTDNLYAPFFGPMSPDFEPDLRAAGVDAWNRFAAEFMTAARGRIYVNAELHPNLDEALASLPKLAEQKFVSVTVPGLVAEKHLPPLFSPDYDPFWAACEDLGLALNVHAGWGTRQGAWHDFFAFIMEKHADKMAGMMGNAADDSVFDFFDFAIGEFDAKNPNSPLAPTTLPQQVLWRLMVGGVFDRHPDLKVVLTEVRADWVPATLAHLDAQFAKHSVKAPLKPSEYFARNCGVTPSAHHVCEVETRYEIGVDQFMFGADIPHPESVWPNTQQWLRDSLKGIPEDEARKIAGENALRFYKNIDRGPIDEAAKRIGITAAEIVSGGPDLDERLIGHFHSRAGYTRGVDQINIEKIDERLVPDLKRLTATAH